MGISARASVSPVVSVNGLVRVTGVSRKKLFFSVGFFVRLFSRVFLPDSVPTSRVSCPASGRVRFSLAAAAAGTVSG